MGWFIGRYVYKTHMDHALHKHGWLTPQIQPQISPGSGNYAVGLTFSLSDDQAFLSGTLATAAGPPVAVKSQSFPSITRVVAPFGLLLDGFRCAS